MENLETLSFRTEQDIVSQSNLLDAFEVETLEIIPSKDIFLNELKPKPESDRDCLRRVAEELREGLTNWGNALEANVEKSVDIEIARIQHGVVDQLRVMCAQKGWRTSAEITEWLDDRVGSYRFTFDLSDYAPKIDVT